MGRPPTLTPQQLLENASRVFLQKGYEATTMAEIAGELLPDGIDRSEEIGDDVARAVAQRDAQPALAQAVQEQAAAAERPPCPSARPTAGRTPR